MTKKKTRKIMLLNYLRRTERYFIKINVISILEASYINGKKNTSQSKIFYKKKLSTEFISC